MKPIALEQARGDAMAALAKIRTNDAERLNALALIESMLAAYQAQSMLCSEAEAPVVRIAGRQLQRIASGLTEPDIKAVGLFLP